MSLKGVYGDVVLEEIMVKRTVEIFFQLKFALLFCQICREKLSVCCLSSDSALKGM